MTRRRWLADEFSGDRAVLLGDHAVHLARVLRAKVGEEFDISTGAAVRRGLVSSVSDDRVEFDLKEEVSVADQASITLLLAVFKFDRLEWAIEKCTELGVARIVPVISQRTDSHLAAAAGKRSERWQRIAQQAAEQSRRVSAPELADPIKLCGALSLSGEFKIVLAESEEKNLLRDALESCRARGAISLAVGPEGGWTKEELQMFREAGWTSASLGNTILRAETAAIAATAIVASRLSN